MAEGDTRTRDVPLKFGEGFLFDIWYSAALGADLKAGKLQRYEILGQPVLLGRDRNGGVYALRDICPHRAAPLSAGRMVSEQGREAVECPYHGWTFRTDGVCVKIPSLVDGQAMTVERIRVRRYPVAETQGLVFIWMAAGDGRDSEPDIPPPTF